MPKLIMMSGPSGSGKSTVSKELMKQNPNLVRLNRDSIRAMSIEKWTPKKEGWIIDAEMAMARAAAKSKKDVLIDDTNLTATDEVRWYGLAQEIGYKFEKKIVFEDILTCVERDNRRTGKERIGRPAIERQFLRGKLWKVPPGMQTVIFDIDGTLADLQHRVCWITIGAECPNCRIQEANAPTCPMCNDTKKVVKKQHDTFYSLVDRDPPIEVVVKWIQACWEQYFVLIVSGRSPESSGDGTIWWLEQHGIKYNHIIMRRAYHHGPDTDEKQMILDDILKIIPKEDITFVVDDRPSVVEMWRKNGLRVFPVRGRDDDDAFYEVMNNLEATHPRSDLEKNESQSG